MSKQTPTLRIWHLDAVMLTTVVLGAMLFLALFSGIINQTLFPTSFLVEAMTTANIGLFVLLNRRYVLSGIQKPSWLLSAFTIGCIILCFVLSGGRLAGTGKEVYRFLSLAILLFSCTLLRCSWLSLTGFALLLVNLALVLLIHETVHINIHDPGNFSGLPFYRAIEGYYRSRMEGQYFRAVWDYGVPYYRPFGVLLQPQKSAFIFPLGIILLYVKRNYGEASDGKRARPSGLWYLVYAFGALLSGGKTAVAGSLSLLLLIFACRRRIMLSTLLLLAAVGGAVWVVMSYPRTSGTVGHDYLVLLDLSPSQLFLGIGFADTQRLVRMGFTSESFLARLIVQVGVLAVSTGAVLATYLLTRRGFLRLDALVLCFLFFSMIHYSVVSVHFVMLVLCVLVMVSYSLKTQRVGHSSRVPDTDPNPAALPVA